MMFKIREHLATNLFSGKIYVEPKSNKRLYYDSQHSQFAYCFGDKVENLTASATMGEVEWAMYNAELIEYRDKALQNLAKNAEVVVAQSLYGNGEFENPLPAHFYDIGDNGKILCVNNRQSIHTMEDSRDCTEWNYWKLP